MRREYVSQRAYGDQNTLEAERERVVCRQVVAGPGNRPQAEPHSAGSPNVRLLGAVSQHAAPVLNAQRSLEELSGG
jgi:hypothetical protein